MRFCWERRMRRNFCYVADKKEKISSFSDVTHFEEEKLCCSRGFLNCCAIRLSDLVGIYVSTSIR